MNLKKIFDSNKKFDLRGLRNCLRKFDADGYHATGGKWEIGNGGYDLDWEIYYESSPWFDCVSNEVEVCQDWFEYSNIDQVLSIIKEIFPYVSIPEQKKYLCNVSDIVWEEGAEDLPTNLQLTITLEPYETTDELQEIITETLTREYEYLVDAFSFDYKIQ